MLRSVSLDGQIISESFLNDPLFDERSNDVSVYLFLYNNAGSETILYSIRSDTASL